MPRFSNKVFKKRVNWRKKVKMSDKQVSGLLSSATSSIDQHNLKGDCSSSLHHVLENSCRKKLGEVKENYRNINTGSETFEVIDISILSEILQNNVLCMKCAKNGICLNVNNHIGLAAELEISCKHCNYKTTFSSSTSVKLKNLDGQISSKYYSVNIRLVYGLRAIGKGRAAGAMLCGVMNLPSPPSKFDRYVNVVGSAVEDIAMKSMKEAVEEAVEENNMNRDITVAFDGSWQKRGHTSLNGIVSATSVDTGKVIDIAIMSKHCKCKGLPGNQHEEQCSSNYSGSSGGMEVSGVKEIFERSLSLYNTRYVRYLGDGDSKAFKAIEERKPYGECVQITKLECVGHVQKRMGSRLRRLKTSMKGKKLSDGRTLDGKNRLTDATIDIIQNYYGLAIRQNTESVEKMRTAVWALFCHISSTDDNPQHALCPKGEESWCKYNRGKITGETYNHPHSLPFAIMEEIKPIFRDLSEINLLKKCLHGRTQNPNECVNSVIWSRLPKTVFVQIKTLHFGVYDAVASFNQGNITKCKVLEQLGLSIGSRTANAMLQIDLERLRQAEIRVRNLHQKIRQARRNAKRKLESEMEEDIDNPSYGAGMH